jgi:hypothetical protein
MKYLAASSVKQTPLERHPPSFVPVIGLNRTLMENSTNGIFWYGILACRFPVGL